MNRPRLVFAAFVISSLFSIAQVNAVDSNSVKISGLQQLTSGPYKPGDLIRFQLKFSDQNSDISRIRMAGDCIIGMDWDVSSGVRKDFFGNGLLTGVITGNCSDGIRDINLLSISDTSDFTQNMLSSDLKDFGSSISYEIKNRIHEPLPGKKSTKLIADKIKISTLPIVFSGKTIRIQLPRFSEKQQALRWILVIGGKDTCSIERFFKFDVAGDLLVSNHGVCIFGATPLQQSRVYEIPILKSNWISYGSHKIASFVKNKL